MGNTERKQIPLRVSKSQKENWEEYQEELGFGSRESMIRRAVEYFYAAKTGNSETELSDEISAQMDDIKNKLDILQADVGDVRREQLTGDDIDDIAEEVDFRLSRDDLFDEVSLDAEIPDEITDEDTIDIVKEQYITGFAQAVMSIRDKDERERMVELLEDQWEEIYGHRLDLSEFE
jgi:hypothetical protein